MTQLSARFDEALAYASAIHRDQKRKGTSIPYVSHLLGVASIALEIGADEDQAIAALLHDAVEDQGGAERLEDIRQTFGPAVAAMVADCSDSDIEPKPPWRERKQAYLAAIPTKSDRSLLVSLADKTHNARAIVDDLAVHGASLWDRFTGGRDGSLWYYDELAKAFDKKLGGDAARRFARIVEQMHRLA